MKFDIVSHACLSVEANSVRLVVDPWLEGPVYWGAWWHCPAAVYDDSIFSANFVYMTHWHFDHMHEDTLRRFDKSCHMLVPKFPVSIMAEGLRELGFTNVTELEHGVTKSLGKDFDFTSFQVSYQDDSVCVIEADGVVIMDVNDAKPLTRAWKHFRERYPQVDFMLRSHSPAWSYPSSYSFDDPKDAIPVTPESYLDAFRSAASIIKPKYAVPFASSVCHPHEDILEENAEVISAFELRDYLVTRPLQGTELAIMPHGSSWSSDTGFDVDLDHGVRDARVYVDTHAQDTQAWLSEIATSEGNARLEFSVFEGYFRNFLRSLILPLRPFLNINLVFAVEQDGKEEFWSVAFRNGKISRSTSEPAGATSVIRTPNAILDDALKTSTFTNIDISKRWQVTIRKGGMTRHMLACVLIALHEAGYTQLKNILSWRFFSGIFSRRAEALDYIALSLKVIRSGPASAATAVTDLD